MQLIMQWIMHAVDGRAFMLSPMYVYVYVCRLLGLQAPSGKSRLVCWTFFTNCRSKPESS